MTRSGEAAPRAIFLDRDGVLTAPVAANGRSRPPWCVQEMRLLPGAVEACIRLHAAGWVLVVATNQPDVARGQAQADEISAIHDRLRRLLPLDDIRVCFHDDADQCRCRKPKPGMLLDAAAALHLELSQSWMVGDRGKDIEAGRAAGCRTLLVGAQGDAADLAHAATIILQDSTREIPS